MIELVWNDEEGQVLIKKEFLMEHRVVQLDALVDWIAELQTIYNSMTANHEQG
jgi:hypothetical protein